MNDELLIIESTMNTNELNDSSSQNASLDLINIGMGLGGVPQQQDLQQHQPSQLANQFSIGNLMKSHTPPPPLPSIPQLNTPNNLLQHNLKPNTKSASKKRKLEDLGLENISDSENSSSGSNSSSKEAKKEMKLDYDSNLMSQLSPNSLSNQHTNNNNNNTNDNNNIKHLDDINNQDNNGVDVDVADPSDYIDLQDPSNSNLLNTSLNLNQQNNQSQQQQDNKHSSIQGDTNDILSPGSQQQQSNNNINSPQSPKNLHLSSSSSNLNQFQSNSNDLSLQNGSLIDNNVNNNNSAPNNSMNQMRSPGYYNNNNGNLNGPPSNNNNTQRQPTPQPSSNSSQSSSSSHPTGPSPPIPLVNSNNCGLNTRMTPPPYNSNQLQQQSPYMSQQQINSPPPANLQQPVPSPIGGPGSQHMPLQAQMQMNQMRQPSPGLAQRNGQLMMNPHQHMTPPPMSSDQEQQQQQQQHNQMMPQHLQMQQQLNPDGSLQSQLQSQQFQNNSGTNSPHMMIPPGAQLPPGHPGHPGHQGHPGHPGMPPHLMHQHSQGSPHMPPHGPPNMMNLVSSNDGHFLQQQNTIFVFTTGLANEAAGAVVKGHFKSIVDFHRQLPATNEFLKSIHHQQQQHLMQQGHQQGMTPPPQQLNGRGPGLPLMQPNEQLTSEQLKKRTEKLGKLKDISSMICPQQQPTPPGMNEMQAQQPSKRGRSSQQKMPQPPPQPPPGHNGPPPQQFMNGDQMMMFPGDQFNPMMPQVGGPGGPPNMPNPYQMDNKEWNRQNMGPNSCSSPSLQQQGPPPPYGQNQFPGKNISSSKLQKAGLPEKFDKLQPGKQMGPNSPASGQNQLENDMLMFNKNQAGITTSGLQTTPSPQLMNYIEFEGQELIITKQLNLSYKGNSNGNDDLNNMNDLKNQYNNPGQNTNSVILNCLNNNNNPSSNQSPSSASSTTSSLNNNNNPNIMNDNQLLLNQDPNLKLMKNELIDNNQNMLLNDQMPPFNGNNQDEMQQMHLNQQHHLNKNGNKNPNDPFFNPNSVPNNAQSPINLVNGGPLNSMLQMTNSIPKASPYATTAKSPGLNQFNAQQGPQMSLSPSPLGMQQHKLMGGPPDNGLMGSNSQPNTPQPQPQLPIPNQASTSRRGHGEPKLTKKEKQLQQQQLQMQQEQQRQQEMMMRGNMGMMDPNNPMQRGPPMPPGAMPGQPMNMPPHMHQQLMNQHHPNMNPMQMPPGQMPPHMMNHLQKGNMQPNFRPEFMGPNGPMNPQMMGQPPNKIMRPSSTDSNEMMFGPGNGNGPPQQFMNGMDPSGNMNPQFMNQQQMMMMNPNGDSFPQNPQSQSPAAQASAPPPKGHRSKNRPNSQNNNQNGPNLNQPPTPNQMLEMEMNSNRPMQPQMLNGQQPPPGMMSHQMQQHLNNKQMGDPNQMFQDPNMNGNGPPNRSIPPMGGPNRPDQMMPPPNQMQQHLMNNPMMRPNQMQQQQFEMMNQQNQQMPPQHQQQFMNQQGQMMHHPSQMNNFMPNNEQMFQNNPNMMDPNQPNQVLPQMLQSQQSDMMMQMNMQPQQQQQQQQQMIPNQMMGQDPLGLGSDFGDPILFND